MTIMIPIEEDSANSDPQGAVAFKRIPASDKVVIQIDDRTVTVNAGEFLSAAGALAGNSI